MYEFECDLLVAQSMAKDTHIILHYNIYWPKKFFSPTTLLPQHNDALDLYFGAPSSIAQ